MHSQVCEIQTKIFSKFLQKHAYWFNKNDQGYKCLLKLFELETFFWPVKIKYEKDFKRRGTPGREQKGGNLFLVKRN